MNDLHKHIVIFSFTALLFPACIANQTNNHIVLISQTIDIPT